MSNYTEPTGFKGTNGEWMQDPEGDIVTNRGTIIAYSYPTTDEVTEANTALICNAKELAKALDVMIQLFNAACIGSGIVPDKYETYVLAKKTLKKAII
jgi:hypothetical protein